MGGVGGERGGGLTKPQSGFREGLNQIPSVQMGLNQLPFGFKGGKIKTKPFRVHFGLLPSASAGLV